MQSFQCRSSLERDRYRPPTTASPGRPLMSNKKLTSATQTSSSSFQKVSTSRPRNGHRNLLLGNFQRVTLFYFIFLATAAIKWKERRILIFFSSNFPLDFTAILAPCLVVESEEKESRKYNLIMSLFCACTTYGKKRKRFTFSKIELWERLPLISLLNGS